MDAATNPASLSPIARPHHCDADCAPHIGPDDGAVQECPVCGVWHADPCGECGGRGYHAAGCSESDEQAPMARYIAATAPDGWLTIPGWLALAADLEAVAPSSANPAGVMDRARDCLNRAGRLALRAA